MYSLIQHVLRKHLLTFLVRHNDLDDRGFSPALERCIVVVDIRREEEFGVEQKALEGGEVRDLWYGSRSVVWFGRTISSLLVDHLPDEVGHPGHRC